MKSLFWRRLYIDFHYLPLKKHGTTCSGNALLMVEVKAYEKWVTKVMSCVSVGLFPNSVGSFKYLSIRSCCQLWIYKYTLTMIVDIYSLQLETSRSTLLKICIVNVKRLLLCVTFQKIKILQEVIFRVAKKRWQKLPPKLQFKANLLSYGRCRFSTFWFQAFKNCAVNIFHAIFNDIKRQQSFFFYFLMVRSRSRVCYYPIYYRWVKWSWCQDQGCVRVGRPRSRARPLDSVDFLGVGL